MGVTVEDNDTGWAQFMASIKTLKRNPEGAVDVGYFTPGVAEYATYNEFPSEHVPKGRPFIRPTIDANKKKYLNKMTKAAARIAFEGLDPSKALISTGNEVRNDIISKIIDLRSPPNKDSTIKKKGSSNPLVDTGQMQRALQVKAGK